MPLFGNDGNFRLVIPKDKRGARSVRLLSRLEVVQLKSKSMRTVIAMSFALILVAAGMSAQTATFQWNIPRPFPSPPVPSDNPMSAAKVELGRYLFYDKRMSVNGKTSCATCHRQELAFTDGRARAEGTTGEIHPRSSMSLANVAYLPSLTWVNPNLDRLEEQALAPIRGTSPVELGLKDHEDQFLSEISSDPTYLRLFPQAFPESPSPYTMDNVTKSIAAFERTLISVRSPYDRYNYGNEPDAISDAARRGEHLFFSGQRAGCFQCHGSWNFDGQLRFEGGPKVRSTFLNIGLYNVTGKYSYPEPNTGLFQFTLRPADVGKFRAPTLRNIAVTAPYMHDGSVLTLSEVIDHYASGGRTISSGPYAGVGHDNPNKAPNVAGFQISDSEKKDLIAFLESLTDSDFLHNAKFSNPWISQTGGIQ
jgi:cytochrome c peroxidase